MKEGWEGGGWESERRGIRKECVMGKEAEIEKVDFFECSLFRVVVAT